MLRAAAQNQQKGDVENLLPQTASPHSNASNEKLITATLRLLKSNPNLTISQAMRAADFTPEESRDVALQMQVRLRMSTKKVDPRTIARWILCSLVLCVIIFIAHHHQGGAPNKPVVIQQAAICAIQKEGLKYVDEWVDYHIGIGFDKIFLYDNSADFELKEWYSKRFNGGNGTDHQVQVTHFPGQAKQLPAYANCTKEIQQHHQPSWIAFIDLDEFFVIKDTKKYPSVLDVFNSISPKAGGLAVNWQFFGWNNQTKYEAKPLTMRFTRRNKDAPINIHVKIVGRSDALIDGLWNTPHEASYKTKFLREKYTTVDTNGETVDGPFNKRLATDVLVLNHYGDKSIEEFRSRCARGRPSPAVRYNKTTYLACQSEEDVLAEWRQKEEKGVQVFDDSAWKLLKERVPAYRKFEE